VNIFWVDETVEDAAEVLIKINPKVWGSFTVNTLIEHIKRESLKGMDAKTEEDMVKGSIWGTGGFFVVYTKSQVEGTYYAEAVLMPYAVKKGLQRLMAHGAIGEVAA
jgi:hypothetical protein